MQLPHGETDGDKVTVTIGSQAFQGSVHHRQYLEGKPRATAEYVVLVLSAQLKK